MLLCALPAVAQENDSPAFDYLYLQAGYNYQRIGNPGLDAGGFDVGGSVDLTHHMFLSADYAWSRTEDFAVNGVHGAVEKRANTIGLGMHTALSGRSDITAALGYVRNRASGKYGFNDGKTAVHEGYSLALGLRYLLRRGIEIAGGPSYTSIAGQDSVSGSVSLIFLLTPAWSVGPSFSMSEDDLGASFNARLTVPTSPKAAAEAGIGQQ